MLACLLVEVSAHVYVSEVDFLRVVGESVDDGVGGYFVGQHVDPVVGSGLGGDDGCCSVFTVCQDCEQVGCGFGADSDGAEVIDDE